MDVNILWSLRLGFNSGQAQQIKQEGIERFLKNSFAHKADTALPAFLANAPKTPEEVRLLKDKARQDEAGLKKYRQDEVRLLFETKAWWIGKMINDPYPLREKMTLFWHNHYVSAFEKVKVNYWIYRHNMVLRENAFGNFRELTKKVLHTNAMVHYLDNTENKKGQINENLSRELLELFTLGIGNYTEQDIKSGAKGLAGLTLGDEGAEYKPRFTDNEPFTYFGKTGSFKADELVDIIFEQKAAPYFLTRKLLKWFIYDNPPEELVTYYGDYFRKVDFEIQPLLIKIFKEEFNKPTAGSKIKDPLVYTLQLLKELNITKQDNRLVAVFLRSQGMDLFNQPSVKGWDGGKTWLASQIYVQRNNVADMLCKGRNWSSQSLPAIGADEASYTNQLSFKLNWDKKADYNGIISKMRDRILFYSDAGMEEDFRAILGHDFDPTTPDADKQVVQLFNYMVKLPEFQLI